jgi:uncharacterized cupin superfamily protein
MDGRRMRATSTGAPGAKAHDAPPAAELVVGRVERRLGELIGLPNVGVNLKELTPGSASFVLHGPSKQDAFVYVLAGRPTLVVGDAELVLQPGDCYGFKAGGGSCCRRPGRGPEALIAHRVSARCTPEASQR